MAEQVIIIGNGIAGITAARHIRKHSDREITVISSETDHFFSRTALMYIYMGHMTFEDTQPYERSFWSKNRIHLRRAHVEHVDTNNRCLRLGNGQGTGQGTIAYDVLIIATGSESNRFGWPGQDARGVQGLYSCGDLESMEASTRGIDRGVVVGGGLIGIETTEMLLARQIPVTLLVREPSWMHFAFPAEESQMINRHIRQHGVDYRLSTELDRIVPDDHGRVRAVITKAGEEIRCQFVALTVGVSPNIGFLADSGIECGRGVRVDEHLRTNIDGVYAIGDCAELRRPAPGRRPVEAVWYVGRAMGQAVAKTICGQPTAYTQTVWFNSAKFFDLEWQIYGEIPARRPETHGSVYWAHPAGDRSIRINYRHEDQAVTGFNLMGIRYRHEICHDWLAQGRSIRYVLENLGAANFDPELYAQFEPKIIGAYNAQHPDQPVTLRRKRGLREVLGIRRAS